MYQFFKHDQNYAKGPTVIYTRNKNFSITLPNKIILTQNIYIFYFFIIAHIERSRNLSKISEVDTSNENHSTISNKYNNANTHHSGSNATYNSKSNSPM